MEALLTHGFGTLPSTPEPEKISATPDARTGRSATIFAAIYLALVLGSPLIVRYGPSTDDHAMAALATQLVKPRCVSNPDSGVVCQGTNLVVRNGRTASEPDL